MEKYLNQLVINKILKNLTSRDLYKCGLVNKTFNRGFNEDMLWKYIFERDYCENIEIYQGLFNTNNCRIIYKKYKSIITLIEKLKLQIQAKDLVAQVSLYLNNYHCEKPNGRCSNLTKIYEKKANYFIQ